MIILILSYLDEYTANGSDNGYVRAHFKHRSRSAGGHGTAFWAASEAITWAARIAKACRCDQELRVFGLIPLIIVYKEIKRFEN